MYELIAKNKRSSWLLVFLLSLVLIAMGAFLGYYFKNIWLGVAFATALAFFSGLIAYYSGDSILLGISKAKRIEKKDAPQLWNVVEELTIASGLPMPKIYLIDDTAPNAFATGRDPEHASVAITKGLIEKLNREELQGVMGHELSHVKNYDILFGTMIAVMVGTIVLLSDFFLRSFFWTGGRRRSSNKSSGKSNAVFLIIGIILAIIAPILAKIIQFSVSRQREYLADASSAKMTRNPIGLAHALEKISEDPEPLEVANKGTQHLYIVNPFKKVSDKSGAFDTHPPLKSRIFRLKTLAHEK